MKIKNSLLDNATLAYYEVGAETEVIVDARPVGLGAMLTQKKRDGHRPVTYISKSLSPVEQRYSQTEREAFAIRWACERLRMYLAGARFKVVTDHKPLEAIFSNSNTQTKSAPFTLRVTPFYTNHVVTWYVHIWYNTTSVWVIPSSPTIILEMLVHHSVSNSYETSKREFQRHKLQHMT